ncbi:MAG: acetyl-CoA hydrolase/transferase C-terminal domain-containing protein, partial [Pseudomonadota bacterium]
MPTEHTTVESCVDAAIAAVGKHLVLGLPLGLGKPNQLVNAFYRRAVEDPSIDLHIVSALSLEKPEPTSDIEARFLKPFVERQFGTFEPLEFMAPLRKDTLPDNVTITEFYFRAGAMKNVAPAQYNYVSTNYTFVSRDVMLLGVNVVVQLVAAGEVDGEPMISLSCNTDVSLDLLPAMAAERARGRPVVSIAQVHADLPFMYNKALVKPDVFDMIVRNTAYDTTLFAVPNASVSPADFMLGFHASTLVRDGGTLQIGIGALGDAITYACQLRDSDNDSYRQIADEAAVNRDLVDEVGGLDRFEEGLYGCSEMFVNGFLHLMNAGILRRAVYGDVHLQRLLNDGKVTADVDIAMLRTLVSEGIISASLTAADVRYLTHWGIFSEHVSHSNSQLHVGDTSVPADLASEDNLQWIGEHALGKHLKHGIIMHGAFFLGPKDFYDALRDMTRAENERICMDSVRQINRLGDCTLHPLQRRHARFINTGMMVTLAGAVVSDGLENGQVISGVGGQYNFVAQAHDLPDARSVLCIRSCRGSCKGAVSNIVPHYGHITIPRHLRDIVITEYGVADLRAKTDSEIIQ